MSRLSSWKNDIFGVDMPDKPDFSQYATRTVPDMSQFLAIETKNQDFLNSISAQQLGIAEEQQEIGKEQYERWKTQLKPVELAYLAKTKAGINPDIYVARARNAIMQQTTPAMKQQQQQDAANNIDSSSAKGVARVTGLSARLANQMADAKTNERDRIDNLNRAKQFQSVGLGRGIPAQAASGLSNSSQQIRAAGDIMNQSNQALAGAIRNKIESDFNYKNSMDNISYQKIMNQYNYDLQVAQAEQAENAATIGTIGTISACAA